MVERARTCVGCGRIVVFDQRALCPECLQKRESRPEWMLTEEEMATAASHLSLRPDFYKGTSYDLLTSVEVAQARKLVKWLRPGSWWSGWENRGCSFIITTRVLGLICLLRMVVLPANSRRRSGL